jgi:hypothetical protein
MTIKKPHALKIISILGFCLLANQAVSHHGWSWYTEDDFTLTATVVQIQFANPHDRMSVEVDGRIWNLLLSPPSRTRRAGLSEDMIQVGDTITAYGHRHADLTNLEMKTERLLVGETLYDLYPRRN